MDAAGYHGGRPPDRHRQSRPPRQIRFFSRAILDGADDNDASTYEAFIKARVYVAD